MVTDRAPPATQPAASLEGIDTASLRQIVDIDPASLQKIVTAIAEAQRTMRSERTRVGLETARQRSQKLGRPCALTKAQIAIARRMMGKGATKKSIAQTLKVAP